MKILYCTTVLPSQQRTGGEIASQSFIDALRRAGHEVAVLGYRRPEDTSPLGAGEMLVGVRPIESDGAGLRPFGWLLWALVSGRPYSCEKYVSAAYRRLLRESLSAAPDSLVILDHAQAAFLSADLPINARVVFVAHNVEAQLYRSQSISHGSTIRRWLLVREAELIGRLEGGLSERASQTWVLTEQDASAFRNNSRQVNVIRCDLPGLARTESALPESEICWDVGLIGTWTWGANAQGLRWFMDRVVPLLPRELRVAVAGKGADGVVTDPVVGLGFVPDAMEFMRSCQVVCIPSVAGGGVQIKTIDAIVSGRPIIATSVALRGIGDPPTSVSVRDDPADFASCISAAIAQSIGCSREAVDWARARRGRFEEQIRDLIGQIGGGMGNSGRQVKLFGIAINALDMHSTVDVIAGWLRANERTCRYVVTPNVDHVVKLATHHRFREAYEGASLVVADGRPVVMASKMFGDALPGTVPGSDLVPAIFDRFHSDGIDELKVFLLGAAPGVAERAAYHIHTKWSHVKVVGTMSPSFGFERDNAECEQICEVLARSGADLLVLGLGAPKQELWAHKYASRLPVKVALCVGATIDFLAGEKPRAPQWMRKYGVEWFHRMASEPRRLAGRYFKDALVFPQLLLKEWWARR